MDFDRHSIGPNDSNRRLDRIVRRFLPHVPLSGIYGLIRKGFIRVDGRRAQPGTSVPEGACIWIAKKQSMTAVTGSSPENADDKGLISHRIRILHETDDLLFIDKPEGISVHGEGSLDSLIPQSAAAVSSLSFRSGPLHRLDKGTSGIIVFSKTLLGARWFSRTISRRECEKLYLGIASGRLEGNAEWYDEMADGKPMITFAESLATAGDSPGKTLIRFRIVTGRKHQIRIQGSRHGFPLEGDERYQPSGSNPLNGYCLHAWRLSFGPGQRPAGVPDAITAPLPQKFAARVTETFGKEALALLEARDIY